MQFVYLLLAIASEVVGTLALRASEGFTKPLWLFAVVVGYGLAFYLMSLALKLGMSVGVGYAIWAALGIVLVAIAAKIIWNDPLTLMMILGIAFIIVGVVLVELGSKHTT